MMFPEILHDIPQAFVHPLDQPGIMLLRPGPLVAVLRVFVGIRKPLVVSALIQRRMQSVMGHVQIKGLASLPGIGPDGFQAFNGLPRQGLRQKYLVLVIIILIQSAHMVKPLSVMPGTAVIRRMADLRTCDIIIKSHIQRIGTRSSLRAEMGLPAMDGNITALLQHLWQCSRRGKRTRHVIAHILPGNGAFCRSPGGSAYRLKAVQRPVRRQEAPAVGVRRPVLFPYPAGHAVPRRIHAGHQAHPGRSAKGMSICIRKRHALGSQLLHIRRPVAPVQKGFLRVALAVGPERVGSILPSHVIYQENDDIGLLSGNRVGTIAQSGCPGKQEQCSADGRHNTGSKLHGRNQQKPFS